MKSDPMQTCFTANIVCPYCFHDHKDSYEYFCNDSEETEMECGDCRKRFVAFRHIRVDYSTYKEKIT